MLPGYSAVMQSLFLLSGLLCDETVWADIPRRLAGSADVHIVSFGALNSLGAMADAVLARAAPQFALAGHSMGGRVALEIWRRAPQRVAGLGLLNTGVHPARDAEYESRGALVRLARAQGMSALAAAWLPPLMGASPARIAELLPLLKAMVERSTPAVFSDQTNALLLRPDARPLLPTIDVPTLLVSGSNDSWPSLAEHADMQLKVPHARLVEIAGSGHMAPLERPDSVARAMRSWLASISQPSGSAMDRLQTRN
jgi:pimeloyl-ACP methyl ester carboxylesterase